MVFAASIIQTVIKAVVIGAVAFGGILFGKHLRTKKNAKEALENNDK
ncbi:MAG: hypothetical protein PHN80_04695 [Hespellia sp.]|nr:hypothetical protein [Hespellia sp.]